MITKEALIEMGGVEVDRRIRMPLQHGCGVQLEISVMDSPSSSFIYFYADETKVSKKQLSLIKFSQPAMDVEDFKTFYKILIS